VRCAADPWSACPRAAAALICVLVATSCGGPGPASDRGRARALPATGRLTGGATFGVTLAPTLDPVGPKPRLVPAWCPRVDLVYPGDHPTHGAVGCREIRPHVPTGGYAIFCRLPEVFVLLLSSPATRSVSVVAASGRTVALAPYTSPGLAGRFWLTHYPGDASPRVVVSVEGARRYRQRYPTVPCLGPGGTNGLLGR
jgi:hypothetical protein